MNAMNGDSLKVNSKDEIKNWDIFSEYVVKIFQEVLPEFPEPVKINAERIVGVEVPRWSEEIDFEATKATISRSINNYLEDLMYDYGNVECGQREKVMSLIGGARPKKYTTTDIRGALFDQLDGLLKKRFGETNQHLDELNGLIDEILSGKAEFLTASLYTLSSSQDIKEVMCDSRGDYGLIWELVAEDSRLSREIADELRRAKENKELRLAWEKRKRIFERTIWYLEEIAVLKRCAGKDGEYIKSTFTISPAMIAPIFAKNDDNQSLWDYLMTPDSQKDIKKFCNDVTKSICAAAANSLVVAGFSHLVP